MTETELLKSARTIAVVGLSDKPSRVSHGIARYLQGAGYKIIPVNPGHPEILGEKSYRRIDDIPCEVDIVNVFRRSEYVPDIADAAIQIGAKGLWLQEGIVHEEAAEKARAAGLTVVMDRCIYKAHAIIR